MKKKLLALPLAGATIFALAACGSPSSNDPGTSQEPSSNNSSAPNESQEPERVESTTVDLHDKSNIDNTIKRDSLTVGWNAPTSIVLWGTANNVAGNCEVYEMLFETSADGEFFALPADASRGEFGGYDHETGTGLYKFVSYTSGASLVIERNDDCWQKEALRRQESQANVGGGHTQEFLVDDEWQGRLSLCNTAGGHTPENMLKWWQHAVDNACTMGLSKYHTIQARYEYVEICCKKIIVAHCHHGLCGSDHFSIVFSCPVSPPKLFWAAGLPLRILNG